MCDCEYKYGASNEICQSLDDWESCIAECQVLVSTHNELPLGTSNSPTLDELVVVDEGVSPTLKPYIYNPLNVPDEPVRTTQMYDVSPVALSYPLVSSVLQLESAYSLS